MMDFMQLYEQCITNIIVEDDNKVNIEALQGKVKTPWQNHGIIKDIHVWKNMGIRIIAK